LASINIFHPQWVREKEQVYDLGNFIYPCLMDGTILAKLGKHADAARQFKSLLKLAPGSADIHANLAASLPELGQKNEAITHCRKALSPAPAREDIKSLLEQAEK
jgi:tetratricopeptide (TPR) repeat protein